MASKKTSPRNRRLQAKLILWVLKAPLILPYETRLAVISWVMAWVFGPLAGYGRRIRSNLEHVCPDLPEPEIRRMTRQVPANTGRMLIEIASGKEFIERLRDIEPIGPGLPALDEARLAKRPIMMVSGHFGNFDAARAVLVRRGHQIGALYRPIDDPDLDAYFLKALSNVSEPIFPRGRQGLGKMLRFLRKGNGVAILLDQYVNKGAPLTFFGQPAPTSLSAAEMALKYDAMLIPIYGIRKGKSFEVFVEEPIPHTDPMIMTQAINDSLEAQVRSHMDQWLWIHRRWKPERQRKRAAAKMRP